MMTDAERDAEWSYRYQERLGILCGSDKPTPQQVDIAYEEADAAIQKLSKPTDNSNPP